MTLKQCTKEELLFVLKYLQEHYLFNIEHHIHLCLFEVQFQREMKRIDKGRKVAKQAAHKREEYCELLKPYEGKKITDIPIDILRKADKCLEEARCADKEYLKIMNIKRKMSNDL